MRLTAKPAPAERADDWQADAPLDPSVWVPISSLALEGFGSADTLDARVQNLRRDLADEVLLDDIGRACVPRSVAREMFSARSAKRAAQREAEERRRAEAAERGHPIRERLRALDRARQRAGTNGLLWEED